MNQFLINTNVNDMIDCNNHSHINNNDDDQHQNQNLPTNHHIFDCMNIDHQNHHCGQPLNQSMVKNINNNHYHHDNHQPSMITQHQHQFSRHLDHSNHYHHQQQRNPFINRSHCVVCGDRARGCNFGAITCASCKEFFRRNAFKKQKLRCYFQEKCEITIHSRRFCAACRLNKCYKMGMKNEYIMSDAEKFERNLKINERKLFNIRNIDHNNHDHYQLDNYQQQQHQNQQLISPNHHQFNGQSLIDDNNNHTTNHDSSTLNHNEIMSDVKFIGNHSDISTSSPSVETTTMTIPSTLHDSFHTDVSDHGSNHSDSIGIINYPNNSTNLEINCDNHNQNNNHETIETKDKFKEDNDDEENDHSINRNCNHEDDTDLDSDKQHMADVKLIKLMNKIKIIRESGYSVTKFHLLLRATSSTMNNRLNNNLNKHDNCRLKYLTSIVQILSAETISDLPTNQKFIDLMSIAEIVTFNFIKMCKKLYTFQELSQEDQVALVKGSVMDTLIIWSMMTINLEKECWEALDLERNFRFTLKLEMLKEAHPKLYEKHHCYVMSFEPEWRYNEYLMSLLIAIALFNPERPNICNVQKIRNERISYCNLMKQYLNTLYEEPSLSQQMYKRLIDQLKFTEQISEYHMKTYFDLNTQEATKNGYGGMIMEIDDLNNHSILDDIKTKCC